MQLEERNALRAGEALEQGSKVRKITSQQGTGLARCFPRTVGKQWLAQNLNFPPSLQFIQITQSFIKIINPHMALYDYVWGNKTTETAKENTAFPTSTFSLALLKGTPYCTERLSREPSR